ncbi:hypothetical protein H6F78_05685 [Coleofasciculus sp. FACHB-64]|uniref:hypothetical protein n=1 Tax=Cyanophyceae TaxID=3028117 RepID=UPI00168436CF|nr:MULTISPECIES: hypothetical protein [unclassified Coleofasciculus]MBD1840376.1 hypothetical protein [Coleofasciculus sp. FACHB-501]MBD2045093.1 hypothetical protein [Coleofasciculus sp. FACHB-64]
MQALRVCIRLCSSCIHWLTACGNSNAIAFESNLEYVQRSPSPIPLPIHKLGFLKLRSLLRLITLHQS